MKGNVCSLPAVGRCLSAVCRCLRGCCVAEDSCSPCLCNAAMRGEMAEKREKQKQESARQHEGESCYFSTGPRERIDKMRAPVASWACAAKEKRASSFGAWIGANKDVGGRFTAGGTRAAHIRGGALCDGEEHGG